MRTRIWSLRDPDLPKEFHKIRTIFLGEMNDRKRNESLHSYLLRKEIRCWCKKCIHQRGLENNVKLGV